MNRRSRIFLSGARDVGPFLEQAHAICLTLAADAARRNQRLEPFYWDNSDIQWTHDTDYQERIPRFSSADTAAAIFIFGERVGSRLPHGFPLPTDFTLPAHVTWKDRHTGAIVGLTGTLYEYFDCLQENERAVAEGKPRIPMLVYFIGQAATIVDRSLEPLRRGWGQRRVYRTIVQENDPIDAETLLVEYKQQIRELATFFDTYIRSTTPGGEELRPVSFIEHIEDFPAIVNHDLRGVLNVTPVHALEASLKGMQAYTPADHYCFFGRTRDARSLVEQFRRRDEALAPTLAVVEAPSGVGKSSFAGAGLIGGARERKFAEFGHLVGQVLTPQQLVDDISRRGDFALGPGTILAELMSRLCDPDTGLELGDPTDTRLLFSGLPGSQALEQAARRITQALDALPKATGSPASAARRRHRLLLVLDQCERLVDDLRNNSHEAALWTTLLQCLTRLADARLAWIVIVLPDSRHQAWNEIPEIQTRAFSFLLRNPDRRELEQIVEGMADSVGARLDDELTRTLIDSAEAFATSPGASEGDAQRVPVLPVISLGVKRLLTEWHRRGAFARDLSTTLEVQSTLDHSSYKSFADLRDVIGSLGEEAWSAALQGRAVVDEDELIGRVLRRLVSMAGHGLRRLNTCPRLDVVSDPDPNVGLLLAALLNRRVVIALAGDALRLVHEIVLDKWSRATAWYEEHRDDLRDLALLEASVDRWAAQPEATRSRYLERNPVPLRFAGYALAVWPERMSPAMREYVRRSLLSFYDPGEDTPSERSGSTLVTFAAWLNDRELIEHYVRVAGSVEILNRKPWSALDGAVWGDHPDLARWCLDGGADVHALATRDGWTTLHLATFRGSVRTMPILLDTNPDLESALGDAKTPLLVAAERGHAQIVSMLLDAGADVNHRTTSGTTILHLAARMGHHGVIDVVAEQRPEAAKALAETLSSTGDAALHQAVRQRSMATVRSLLHAGSPVEFPFSDQPSPTHLAIRNGSWEVASTLMAHGGSVPLTVSGTRVEKLAQGATIGRLFLEEGDFLVDLTSAGSWAEFPAMRGEWRDLPAMEAASLLARFANEQLGRADPSEALLYEVTRVRTLPLTCFPGHRLVECEVRKRNGQLGINVFLEGPAGCVPLDGTNLPVYQMVMQGRLDLSSHARVADYIRLFFGVVAGRHGRFVLLESVADASWSKRTTEDDRQAVAGLLSPIEVRREEREGSAVFAARTMMGFKDSLFVATITVSREGIVQLGDEELLQDNLPMLSQRIDGMLRYSYDPRAAVVNEDGPSDATSSTSLAKR